MIGPMVLYFLERVIRFIRSQQKVYVTKVSLLRHFICPQRNYLGVSEQNEYMSFNNAVAHVHDQESIQSSTTPDPGYQWESDKLIVRHHK